RHDVPQLRAPPARPGARLLPRVHCGHAGRPGPRAASRRAGTRRRPVLHRGPLRDVPSGGAVTELTVAGLVAGGRPPGVYRWDPAVPAPRLAAELTAAGWVGRVLRGD